MPLSLSLSLNLNLNLNFLFFLNNNFLTLNFLSPMFSLTYFFPFTNSRSEHCISVEVHSCTVAILTPYNFSSLFWEQLSKSVREVSKFVTIAVVDIDSADIQVYVKYFDIIFLPSMFFSFNAHHMKMDSGYSFSLSTSVSFGLLCCIITLWVFIWRFFSRNNISLIVWWPCSLY